MSGAWPRSGSPAGDQPARGRRAAPRTRWRRACCVPLVLAEMETLHDQISGSNFMIAFALTNGIILDTIADRTSTRWRGRRTSSPADYGRSLVAAPMRSAARRRRERAITVHGGEHFFSRYGKLTCTAAPVFGPDGTVAGVLDASSDCSSRQQHTRALVSMAATQIENGLFREHHRDAILVAFHNRAEYLHTLSAGADGARCGGRGAEHEPARAAVSAGSADGGRPPVPRYLPHGLRRFHRYGQAGPAGAIAGPRGQRLHREHRDAAAADCNRIEACARRKDIVSADYGFLRGARCRGDEGDARCRGGRAPPAADPHPGRDRHGQGAAGAPRPCQ